MGEAVAGAFHHCRSALLAFDTESGWLEEVRPGGVPVETGGSSSSTCRTSRPGVAYNSMAWFELDRGDLPAHADRAASALHRWGREAFVPQPGPGRVGGRAVVTLSERDQHVHGRGQHLGSSPCCCRGMAGSGRARRCSTGARAVVSSRLSTPWPGVSCFGSIHHGGGQGARIRL